MTAEVTIRIQGAETATCDCVVRFRSSDGDGDEYALGTAIGSAVRAVDIARPMSALAKAVLHLHVWGEDGQDSESSPFVEEARKLIELWEQHDVKVGNKT